MARSIVRGVYIHTHARMWVWVWVWRSIVRSRSAEAIDSGAGSGGNNPKHKQAGDRVSGFEGTQQRAGCLPAAARRGSRGLRLFVSRASYVPPCRHGPFRCRGRDGFVGVGAWGCFCRFARGRLPRWPLLVGSVHRPVALSSSVSGFAHARGADRS